MNLIEKYLAAAAGMDSVTCGQDITCRIRYAAAHDVTAPIAIQMFRQIGVDRVFDRDSVLFVVDHIYPAASEKARRSVWMMEDFAREFGIRMYQRGQGVIHQLMYERHRARPGEIVAIADSHTCTCGGYGAIGIGVGSTELAAAMATGKLDLEVPEVVQVYLTGEKPGNVFGKDLILWLAKKFGTDHLVDKALLLTGPGIDAFSTEERMSVCNMGTELGSMITLFGTTEYEAETAQTWEVDLTKITPQIAKPYSPANVTDAASIEGLPITQVVIGSCTNGRLSDMAEVVKVFSKHPVHPDVNTLVVPSSVRILDEMEKRGWCQIIREAGAVLLNPGCGPCFGAHEGLITERDVVVSTTNRNFPGRMGSQKGQIYLASPATAARCAVAGHITYDKGEVR